MIAPLFFVLNRQSIIALQNRAGEAIAWSILTHGVTWSVFYLHRIYHQQSASMTFIPLALGAWGVMRFGPIGTPVAMIIITIAAVVGTFGGYSPVGNTMPGEEMLMI